MTTSEILVQYINETLGIPVYFDHAPLVGATYPCIAYKKIASESDHTFDGPAYSTDTYEFTVLTIKGSNAGINVPLYGIEGARFWAKSLNTILDGYDTSMYSINTSYNEEYDDDTATYQVMQSYGLLLMTGDVYTGSWTGSSQYSDILRGNGTPGNVAVWESPYVITETNTLTISGSDVIMVGDLTVHGTIHAVISASADSSSYADKAHLADTASYSNYAALAGTSSFAVTSSYAVTSTTANTASYLTGTIASASYATTASYALNSQSIPAGVLSSSAQVDYNQIQNKPTAIATASYVLNAVSASYAPMADGVVSSSAQVLNGSNVYSSSAQLPDGIVSGSQQIAGWSVLSSSYALTASYSPLPDNPIFQSVGIGVTQSAYLHIKAGTTAAGTAPVKFTSGSLTTIPESGTIEFDGSDFWLTI